MSPVPVNDKPEASAEPCVIHEHPMPAEELDRYSIERDPHSERDIASYVEGQARDEAVQHVEKIKSDVILGTEYDVWDVVTDKGRWWVITNLTNLYSQKHFPSLDYTLSFHIGLMARMRSRQSRIDATEPTPFDEVIRRMDQAERKLEIATEPEDFQAVGMHAREALISLANALRRRIELPAGIEQPQSANFIAWSQLLAEQICGGRKNEALRKLLKGTAKDTWQLVNWLTHDRDANQTAASVAMHSSQTVVGHFIQVLERSKTDKTAACPVCKSRDIRSHFDMAIAPDGDYYTSCGACAWSSHPGSSS
jgi:hypothetical protein